MADPLDPHGLVTLEELVISTMWENAALQAQTTQRERPGLD